MIKIEFTCYRCGESSEISADDIDEKATVPVCDNCYKKFLSRESRLVKSFQKKLRGIYSDYGIPVNTFNVSEEITFEE